MRSIIRLYDKLVAQIPDDDNCVHMHSCRWFRSGTLAAAKGVNSCGAVIIFNKNTQDFFMRHFISLRYQTEREWNVLDILNAELKMDASIYDVYLIGGEK